MGGGVVLRSVVAVVRVGCGCDGDCDCDCDCGMGCDWDRTGGGPMPSVVSSVSTDLVVRRR
jgi:hypothetical protein